MEGQRYSFHFNDVRGFKNFANYAIYNFKNLNKNLSSSVVIHKMKYNNIFLFFCYSSYYC